MVLRIVFRVIIVSVGELDKIFFGLDFKDSLSIKKRRRVAVR